MSRASGQVAAVVEFVALFIVQSIYTRLVRESEQPNPTLRRTAAGRRGCNRCASWPPSLRLGASNALRDNKYITAG